MNPSASLSSWKGTKPDPTERQKLAQHVAHRGGGGVFPIMAYMGDSTQKGYLFQASVIWKGKGRVGYFGW